MMGLENRALLSRVMINRYLDHVTKNGWPLSRRQKKKKGNQRILNSIPMQTGLTVSKWGFLPIVMATCPFCHLGLVQTAEVGSWLLKTCTIILIQTYFHAKVTTWGKNNDNRVEMQMFMDLKTISAAT